MKPKLDFYEIVQPFSLSSGNDDIWILHKENKVLNSFWFFLGGGLLFSWSMQRSVCLLGQC